MIWGMASLIDFQNSATSTLTTFRSENLISYHVLRILIMHFQLPYECLMPPWIQGG